MWWHNRHCCCEAGNQSAAVHAAPGRHPTVSRSSSTPQPLSPSGTDSLTLSLTPSTGTPSRHRQLAYPCPIPSQRSPTVLPASSSNVLLQRLRSASSHPVPAPSSVVSATSRAPGPVQEQAHKHQASHAQHTPNTASTAYRNQPQPTDLTFLVPMTRSPARRR